MSECTADENDDRVLTVFHKYMYMNQFSNLTLLPGAGAFNLANCQEFCHTTMHSGVSQTSLSGLFWTAAACKV